MSMNFSVTNQFSFSNPLTAPLRSVDTIAAPSALVVAPHSNDETLGCGGAIALFRALGCAVRVLVVSDGTLSHPQSVKYPAPRLQALRETETLEAMSILDVKKAQTTFLKLQDGSIPTPTSPEVREAVAHCHMFLEMVRPATIFLPWRLDPHPDHRATWHLIHAAVADLDYLPRMLEYPIWDWDPNQRTDLTHWGRVIAWRLDIKDVLETKLKAIAAYRSQVTDLIDDDLESFQLTSKMLENFSHPWELYLEEI